MLNYIKVIVVVLILSFPSYVSAQEESKSVKERKKELAENEEKRKKEDEAFLKEMKKRQKDIQSKEVKKRMKNTRKKSNRTNANKREFFLFRWFK